MKRHAPDMGAYLQDTTFVGMVKSYADGRVVFEQRNRVFDGDVIEILSPDTLGASFTARDIIDANGISCCVASRPSEIYSMACDVPVRAGDLLRVRH